VAKQFFITGTDTGVGKTVLSALLCVALDASYWKPIQTGAEEDSDSKRVSKLAELQASRIFPEAYRFAQPVSPHLAARWAGARIELEKIQIPETSRSVPLIVEGAGGVIVPLNERDFMVDLIRRLGLPVLIAARSSLGTINHTLLTLKALREANATVAGVVLIGEPNAENREAIEKYGKVRVVGEIPRLQEINRAKLMQVFESRFDQEFFSQREMAAGAATRD
jgi:dethiobiotin synthase